LSSYIYEVVYEKGSFFAGIHALFSNLEKNIYEANSYLQSGNFDAAEKNINDIRSIDPEFPGLDSVYSRFEAAKNQDSKKTDKKE
jgi:hypothetical protein